MSEIKNIEGRNFVEDEAARKVAEAVLKAAGSGFHLYETYTKERIVIATVLALRANSNQAKGE